MRIVTAEMRDNIIEMIAIYRNGVFSMLLNESVLNFNDLGILLYPSRSDLLSRILLLKGEEVISEMRNRTSSSAQYGMELRLYLTPVFQCERIMRLPEYELHGVEKFWEPERNVILRTDTLPVVLF